MTWTANSAPDPWINSNPNGPYAVDESLSDQHSGRYRGHDSIGNETGYSETGHLGSGDQRNSSLSSSSIDSESSQSSLPTPVSMINFQPTADGWEQGRGPPWDVVGAPLDLDAGCSVIYEGEKIQVTDPMSWSSTAEPAFSKQFRPALRGEARHSSSPQMNPRCEVANG